MALTKFQGESTNFNRSNGGSEGGKAGRKYPALLAERLENDVAFRVWVCKQIGRNHQDFNYAVAGAGIPKTVSSICDSGSSIPPKTNLRIVWKDGLYSNFRVKTASPAQIHLEITSNFIAEYEAQFQSKIPALVKDALLLFTGRHPDQRRLLDSVPVNYVGDTIRDLERKYFSRFTLASMYGINPRMAEALLGWLRKNIGDIFLFCFSVGASKWRNWAPDYLWYHGAKGEQIFNISTLLKKIQGMTKSALEEMIRPNDARQVGSTIALPFGNLQYHLHALQFRHDPRKIEALSKLKRKTFGSKQKTSGHDNELKIAHELNSSKEFRAHFCDRVGHDVLDFDRAEAGGASAKKELSVLGGKTTGKTDVSVFWKSGGVTNISVKKTPKGQVYLVGAKNFADVYEAQYGVLIPSKVRRALAFFTGEATESRSILEATDIKVDGTKARKIACESNYRLMFNVIKNYDARMAAALLSYLKENIPNVFEVCFAAGAVKDRSLWSNVLWYKNLVDDEGMGLDYLIPLPEIKAALVRKGEDNEVLPGPKNAGSTIHLPFGHLQYHNKQLEFYQILSKIQGLLV